MLKRDRTPDEKRFDGMLRVGLSRLGENPSKSSTGQRSEVAEALKPTTYFLAWDRWGRKGQTCRLVNPKAKADARMIEIQFEDGFIGIVSRFAIRRSD